jgi:hypothetical protein
MATMTITQRQRIAPLTNAIAYCLIAPRGADGAWAILDNYVSRMGLEFAAEKLFGRNREATGTLVVVPIAEVNTMPHCQ